MLHTGIQVLKSSYGRCAVNKGQYITSCIFSSNIQISRGNTTESVPVVPGNISPTKTVPDHIEKPPYAEKAFWLNMKNKYVKPVDIEIKDKKQVQGMIDACKLAREMLDFAGGLVYPGVKTDAIDTVIHEEIIANNAYPSPLLYKGFPKSICTSVNNVACHGIPDDRELCRGDIINIDVTVYYKGFHGDCSETYIVGETSAENEWLIEVTKQCRDLAIQACGPFVPFNIIGQTIRDYADEWNFKIVEQFCGHGIGSIFHAAPDIAHVENLETRLMQPNMTFTIEPILSAGESSIHILSDGWTAVTDDHSNTAQFEHTVMVTNNGCVVLTK